MTKKVLFLFANRPFPLHIQFMEVLESDARHVSIVFMNRKGSSHSVPLNSAINPDRCAGITWKIGRNIITKSWNKLVALHLFAKRIRQCSPDIVHAWNFEMLLAALWAKRRMPELQIVFTLQDTTQWMVSRVFHPLQRWAYKNVDLFFVTSRGFEEGLLRKFHLIPPSRMISFVPNAPPASFFLNLEPCVPRKQLVIGCVGTLRGKEGLSTLVQAVGRVRLRGEDVKIIFAGSGIEQALVEKFSEEHEYVEYLGSYDYEKEILGIYSQIDVFYAIYDCSYDKTIHLAYRYCEAVSCRRPIVVASNTHMAKMVKTHQVGESVTVGNVQELEDVLFRLVSSPERCAELSSNCVNAIPECVFETYEDAILEGYSALT